MGITNTTVFTHCSFIRYVRYITLIDHPSLLSTAVMNTITKNYFRREEFILPERLYFVTERSQGMLGGNRCTDTEAEAMEHCLLACVLWLAQFALGNLVAPV